MDKNVWVVHGGDTEDGSSWIVGVFNKKKDAVVAYHDVIARDCILCGGIDKGQINSEDEDLDCCDEGTKKQIIYLLVEGKLKGVDYTEYYTVIDARGQREISYYVSLVLIQ